MELVLFYIFITTFACYGIAGIISETYIFKKFRTIMDSLSPKFLGILFSCIRCTGFWVGILLHCTTSIFLPLKPMLYNTESPKWWNHVIAYIVVGAMSSAISWVMKSFVGYLNQHEAEDSEMETTDEDIPMMIPPHLKTQNEIFEYLNETYNVECIRFTD